MLRALVAPALALAALAGAALTQAQPNARISLTEQGAESAEVFPRWVAASRDGRHIAWADSATDLVASPSCTGTQIYVRDRDPDGNGTFDEGNGTTSLVSAGYDGSCGNSQSGYWGLEISGSGRFVVWASNADNLVPEDTSGPYHYDLFVRDRDPDENGLFDEGNAVTTRLLDPNGNELDMGVRLEQIGVSDDGRYLAFASNSSDLLGGTGSGTHVFRWDRETDEIIAVSVPTATQRYATQPHISADGRHVVFVSADADLVSGDTNGVLDVFVATISPLTAERVRVTRVSVNDAGAEGDAASADTSYRGPRISGDGRFVTFRSEATNLDSVQPDSNGRPDIFLHDRDADGDGSFDEPGAISTRRISIGPGGAQAASYSRDADLSDNGFQVVFQGPGSLDPDDSANGFDILAYDRITEATRLVSRAVDGTPSHSTSSRPVLAGDGSQIAFLSPSSDLITGDTNGRWDVFARAQTPVGPPFGEPSPCTPAEAARLVNPTPADGDLYGRALDTDGTRLAFRSGHGEVSILVTDDAGGWTLEQVITDPDPVDSLFAPRVAIHGDALAITDWPCGKTRCANDVRIYECVGNTWTPSAVIHNPNPGLLDPEDDAFGLDLALDSIGVGASVLMIGACQEDLPDADGNVIEDAGAVYAFQKIRVGTDGVPTLRWLRFAWA